MSSKLVEGMIQRDCIANLAEYTLVALLNGGAYTPEESPDSITATAFRIAESFYEQAQSRGHMTIHPITQEKASG